MSTLPKLLALPARGLRGIAAVAACLGASTLSGCIVETLHVPERTGGEQAVMARAIERACEKLPLDAIGTSRVRIEVATLAPDSVEYIESVLRLRLLKQGATVAADEGESQAEKVLHVLVTETGPETRTKVFQIPLPIPVTAIGLPVGLTFWDRQTEQSVVRMRGYVVDVSGDRLLAELQSSSGAASTIETVLFGIVGPFRKKDPNHEAPRGPSPTD